MIAGTFGRRRRPRAIAAAIGIMAALGVAAWGTPATAAPALHRPEVLTTFPTDVTFAESMVVGPDRAVYAAVTRWRDPSHGGRIWRVTPAGQRTAFGPRINAGIGLITGIAFDDARNLYVAVSTFGDAPRPKIVRIDRAGHLERVCSLPTDSFPNGIAVHDHAVFVTDSALGTVWRVTSPARRPNRERWVVDDALVGTSGNAIGANGIAFRGGDAYVSVSQPGSIVRIPVAADGTAGALDVVASRPALRTADGVAFDARGRLWIAVNEGRIVVMSRSGELSTFTRSDRWLNYPTAVAFGGRSRLYIENGAFEGGTPNILVATVGPRT